MHARMHAHMHAHTYARTHACTHACTHTRTHTHTRMHEQTLTHAHTHTHTYNTNTHKHTRARTRARTHARMHAHTHTHKQDKELTTKCGHWLRKQSPHLCGWLALPAGNARHHGILDGAGVTTLLPENRETIETHQTPWNSTKAYKGIVHKYR